MGAESIVRARGPQGVVELAADAFEASVRAWSLPDDSLPDRDAWAALANVGVLCRRDQDRSELEDDADGEPLALGPYRLTRWMGRGSFGVVWAALHVPSGETHAVKIIDSRDAVAISDLKHEAHTAWSLCHPGVIVPIALRHDARRWYLAMELVAGKPLDVYLAGVDASLRAAEIERTFAALGNTVEFLHRNGVVHGDLKPPNVLIRRDGTIAVIDLGFARWQRPGVVPARPVEGFAGTPTYLAPEVFLGAAPSPATDWYAVGVMLHEVLTGRLLHDEGGDWLTRRLSGVPPAPIQVPASLAHLARIAGRLVEFDAKKRGGAGDLGARYDIARAPSPVTGILVGRDTEIQALSRTLSQLAKHPGRVEIRGEPGSGKTALLQWFADGVAIADPGAVVLRARCYEHDQLPFAALDGFMAGLVAALEVARVDLDPSDMVDVAALFPAIFSRAPRPEQTEDAASRRLRAVQALQRWLMSLASKDRRILVLVDDIQWGDRDSGRLLGEVLSDLTDIPLLVVTSSRQEAGAAAFDEELRRSAPGLPTLEGLNLDPIEAGAGEVLVRRLLGPGAADSLVRALVEQGAGNPFLIAEVVQHQLAFGTRPPASLRSVVQARLAALSSPEAEVIRCVSIAGGPIEETVVRALASRSGADPAATTVRLRLRRFIRTAPRADSIIMYHDRLREECAALLGDEDRLRCHSALLAVLAPAGVGPGRLFPHLKALGRRREAVRAAEEAAKAAEQGLAFAQAADWYGAAAELSLDGPERSDLLEHKGGAEFSAGLTGHAGASFQAASVGAAGPRRVALERRASEAWLLAGRFDDGLRVIDTRLRELDASYARSSLRVTLSVLRRIVPLLVTGPEVSRAGPTRADEEAAMCWTLAKGLAFVDSARGLDYTLRALEAARTAGDRQAAARAASFLAASVFLHIPALRSFGRRCTAYARGVALETGDAHLGAAVDLWEGMAAVAPGNWALAASRLERALRTFEERPHGHHWERGVAAGLVAWLMQLAGDFTRERELVWRYLRDAIERGDRYQEVLFSQYVAYVYLAEGRPEPALHLAREVASAWRARGYSVLAFYGMFLEVMAHLYQGHVEEARRRWKEDQAPFRRAGFGMVPQTRIDNALLEARLLLREGRATHGSSGLAALRRMAARFRREVRTDGLCYARWLDYTAEAWSRRSSNEDLLALADHLARAGLEVHAHVARWRASGDPSALRARGVADPDAWASAFLPLEP